MAIGDYIICCKCEVKLLYDGDRGNREWWKDRFGAEPKIKCPDCEKEEQGEPLEYWNAVEGWVKLDEVREHFDSVSCATIYKNGGEGRVPLSLAKPKQEQDEPVTKPTEDMVLALRGNSGLSTQDAYDALVDVLAVMPFYTTPRSKT